MTTLTLLIARCHAGEQSAVLRLRHMRRATQSDSRAQTHDRAVECQALRRCLEDVQNSESRTTVRQWSPTSPDAGSELFYDFAKGFLLTKRGGHHVARAI